MIDHVTDLKARIGTLDDKQAIHVTNSLVQAAFAAPTFEDLDDRALLGRITDEVRQFDKAGQLESLRTNPHWTDTSFDGHAAGNFARQGLLALAEQPNGNELVTRALDEFFDSQADFGVLTGAVAIGFVWLILSGEIEFKIGSFSYRKAGLSGKEQASVAPAVIGSLESNLLSGRAGE
jgi:hypothetical protein